MERSDLPPPVLAGPERTIAHLLLGAAERHGDRVAVTDGHRAHTFTDLPSVAARGAATLRGQGVRPGDRVVVASGNRTEILEVFLACAWGGALFVPLNPALPAAQMERVVGYLDPSLIIADDEALALPADPWRRFDAPLLRLQGGDDGSWHLADDGDRRFEVGPGDPASILMTSGTTGNSKGVVCPNGQFIQWGESVGTLLELGEDDVAFTCLPLTHTNALNAFLQTLRFGARYHLGDRFSVSRFLDQVREADATVTYLLGAMVGMLLTREPGVADRAHRVSRILAPGTPAQAVEQFEVRFGATLLEGHGMTETNLVIAPPRGERRLGFMGTVVPGFDVRIVDDQGEDVPEGTPGELIMRTDIPSAFALGYWELPEATAAAHLGPWFRSGDRAVEDAGWYRFVDRIKDVIRRRGENISAFEVEQVLEASPHVAQSAVVPVPSELGEDEVMAFVRLEPGAVPSPEDLIAHASQGLPRFAVPRFVEFVDTFPLTETGKIRKQALRERGVGVHTWDRSPGGRPRQ